MKRSMTFLLSLSVVAYSSGASVYAQGKSVGRSSVPTVSQGHGQSGTRPVKTTSGPSAEHAKGQPTKTTWETKLSQRFESDAAFRTRMENLLPEGMSLETAQSGFKNRGQFIAALHVSQNLGIAFDQLKEKMTGIPATPDTTTTTSTTSTTTTAATTQTNSEPMSLGKAIQELKPTLTSTEVTVEVKKAEKQAGTTEKTAPTS